MSDKPVTDLAHTIGQTVGAVIGGYLLLKYGLPPELVDKIMEPGTQAIAGTLAVVGSQIWNTWQTLTKPKAKIAVLSVDESTGRVSGAVSTEATEIKPLDPN